MNVDPARLGLLLYPDPLLRRKASPIPEVTDEVRAVASRMIEIMREHEGIGLAGPQVGVPWRIFVTAVPALEDAEPGDPPEALPEPTVFINPVLSSPEGRPESSTEGCLSLPEIRGEVLRPPIVTITALDAQGREFTLRAGGLLARCWQHEADHLDGVLIIDRMSHMSRLKNRAAVRDLERDFKPSGAR